MLQKNIALLSIISFFLLVGITTTVFAQPEVSVVTGTINHKSTIVINGDGFGTKSPAPPLIWDDCEDKTLNDHIKVFSEGGWDEAWPYHDNCHEDWEIQYRAILYRNVGGPHQRSQVYLAGGHYQEPTNMARAVMVTKDSGQYSNVWYAIWYVRLDPNWPQEGYYLANYKATRVQADSTAYMGSAVPGSMYTSCTSCICRGLEMIDLHASRETCGSYVDSGLFPSELYGWRHREYLQRQNPGRLIVKSDNVYTPYDLSCEGDLLYFQTRSFSIGGFARYNQNGSNGYLHNDMFRYFDDLYIDTTWSRVMLADRPNYDNATIIEPQIPSVWSDDSIICTVNLGRLSNEKAYLFVFDKDNNHNSEGYPVSINYAGEDTQPEVPTGLSIADIEY